MHKPVPSQRFIAQGVRQKANGRFIAQYSAPGALPRLVLSEDGSPVEFVVEQEAEIAAMYALFASLNAPRVKERIATWGSIQTEKWGGADLGAALSAVGLAPEVFADIYGTKLSRMSDWLGGKDAVPHPVRLLLSIFRALPEAIEVAVAITASIRRNDGGTRADRGGHNA